MSRQTELARERILKVRDARDVEQLLESVFYLNRALGLALEAIEPLEELVDDHRSSSDSHARLV